MADLARLNIAVNTRGARQQLGAFRTAMATTSRAVTNQVNRIQGSFRSVTSAIFGLQGALAGVGLALGAGAVVQTSLRLDRLRTALTAVSGSSVQTNKTLQTLEAMSDRLGVNFLATAEGFKNFSIASRTAGMDADTTNKIFEAVVTAGGAMKLSTDDMSGSLRALQQMISKGNVQAEELRGQLGERLPGAFAMSAEALGVTTKQLNKMLDNGEVLASDLLPKLGNLLMEKFKEPAEVASKSATAEFNRFFNAIDKVKIAIGEAGLIGVLVNLTDGITKFIKSGGFMNFFGDFLIGGAMALDRLVKLSDEFKFFFNMVVSGVNKLNDFAGGTIGELGLIGFILFGKRGLRGGIYLALATGIVDALLEKLAVQIESRFPAVAKGIRNIKVGQFTQDMINEFSDQVLREAGLKPEEIGSRLGMMENITPRNRAIIGGGDSFEFRMRRFINGLEKQRKELEKISGSFFTTGKIESEGKEQTPFEKFFSGVEKGFENLSKNVVDFAKIGEDAVKRSFGAMDNAIEQLVKNGKINMKAFAQDILIYFAQISARMAVISAYKSFSPNLMSFLGGFGGGSVGGGGASSVAGAGGVGLPPMAYGGAVSRGSPYLVGERGAEIFVPNQSGRIVPNAGGSTIVNNYDFRGADRSAVAQLEMMAENIKQETFKMVFGSIEQGGRFAKATGRRA